MKLEEGRKRDTAANALLALSFAASAAQSPKDLIRSGNIEGPGMQLMSRMMNKRKKATASGLDNPRVSEPARNRTFKEFLEIAEMQLDEGIRNPDVPRRSKKEFRDAKKIMSDINTQREKDASTNRVKKLIRNSRGEPKPEPPAPGRVGNPAAAPPSGEGLNPERKPPRPRVVTPYVPPEGTENLAARTAKIRPFGTVYEPPAAPKRRERG